MGGGTGSVAQENLNGTMYVLRLVRMSSQRKCIMKMEILTCLDTEWLRLIEN